MTKETILIMNHRTGEYWLKLPGGQTIHFPSTEAWMQTIDFFKLYERWASQSDKPFPETIKQIDLHKGE